MVSKGSWFEVWADDGLKPPYLLLVCPDPVETSKVAICDPKDGYRVIHCAENYDSIKLWLLEDEYTLVDGRMYIE